MPVQLTWARVGFRRYQTSSLIRSPQGSSGMWSATVWEDPEGWNYQITSPDGQPFGGRPCRDKSKAFETVSEIINGQKPRVPPSGTSDDVHPDVYVGRCPQCSAIIQGTRVIKSSVMRFTRSCMCGFLLRVTARATDRIENPVSIEAIRPRTIASEFRSPSDQDVSPEPPEPPPFVLRGWERDPNGLYRKAVVLRRPIRRGPPATVNICTWVEGERWVCTVRLPDGTVINGRTHSPGEIIVFVETCIDGYRWKNRHDTVVPVPFAERLRFLRLERELSQEELAQAVGVTRSAIAAWENRTHSRPSKAKIHALSLFFKVSPEYLWGQTAERQPGAEESAAVPAQ